jgi:hypothetical protein
MKLFLVALYLSLAVAANALTQDEAKKIYDADTKRVLAGDLKFDWKEYRLAAVQRGQPNSDWRPVREQFMKQLNSGDNSAAMKSAQQLMNHNMAEPEGHLLALVVYQKLGREQEAVLQHDVVKAYLDSILSSGDGKSSKTAFGVVSVDEEYFYLTLVLGVGLPEHQSLSEVDGHSYDVLKVKGRDGAEQEIWHPRAWQEHRVRPPLVCRATRT